MTALDPDAASELARSKAHDPLLVDARAAAALLSVSRSTVLRLNSIGCIPAAVRIGARTLWRVEELREWVNFGCPKRETWEVLRGDKWGAPELSSKHRRRNTTGG